MAFRNEVASRQAPQERQTFAQALRDRKFSVAGGYDQAHARMKPGAAPAAAAYGTRVAADTPASSRVAMADAHLSAAIRRAVEG
jgi:hypothetical protein